jgi:SPP1 gp7 family putative phage head morphogenesis protein
MDALIKAVRVQVVEELPTIMAMANAELGELDRADEFDDELDRMMARAEARWRERFNAREIRETARDAGKRISELHRRGLERVFQGQTGQFTIREPAGADARVRAFANRNASLVENAARQHFEKIRTAIQTGIGSGRTPREVEAQIRKAEDQLIRRTQLIAKDQTEKIVSELQRTRLKANGIREFIWVTVGDDNVRDLHQALEGQVFPIDKGAPDEGFPGDPINCRCSMEPVFPR